MRVSDLRALLAELPDYYDVPEVHEVRTETRVAGWRDATGRPCEAAVVVVIC